jgi:hypothetical protein
VHNALQGRKKACNVTLLFKNSLQNFMVLGDDATSITKQLQPFGLVPARLCGFPKVHMEAVSFSPPSE